MLFILCNLLLHINTMEYLFIKDTLNVILKNGYMVTYIKNPLLLGIYFWVFAWVQTNSKTHNAWFNEIYLRLLKCPDKCPSSNLHQHHTIYKSSTFFFFFRAALKAYGGSQARGQIEATSASRSYSDSSHLWPTPQLTANAGSPTHWARSGIKPESSWILVRFVFTEPRRELP